MAMRLEAQCPKCGPGHMVQVFDKAPMFVRDIDSQDGRVNESVEMPGLGVRLSSRSQLKGALDKAREDYFHATDGEKTVDVPVQNEDGTVTFEKVTTVHKGVDLGEIHPVETNVGFNDPVEPSTGCTYSSQIQELEDKLGE